MYQALGHQVPPRHKVFVSFHNADWQYKKWFVESMGDDIVDRSVGDGDINDDNLKTDTIRQYIRDRYIADATVIVVLVGPCTWQRKHVDWEIGSSLRVTMNNPIRCGLLGILLPNHLNYSTGPSLHNPRLIPPRLADNCGGFNPYARLRAWTYNTHLIRTWIHTAFERRFGTPPDNSRRQYKYNRSGPCLAGWQD